MRSLLNSFSALTLVYVFFSGASYGAVNTTTCMEALSVPVGDCEALVELYNSTQGVSWETSTYWGTTNAPWYGVTVIGGRVARIELFENNLTGVIPAELGNLGELSILSLWDNALTGTIPPALGSLANLERLFLYNNQLTGSIPANLDALSNLRLLSLAGNQLTGAIPPGLGDLGNLISLSLNTNRLAGEIPAELGDLSDLGWLSISENQLTGAIPTELGNLGNLGWLFLNNNHLDADANGDALIPSSIQSWYDDLVDKDISNQTMPFYLLPRGSWRYRIFRDASL